MSATDKENPMARYIVAVDEKETEVTVTLKGLPWNARRRWAFALGFVRSVWKDFYPHLHSWHLPPSLDLSLKEAEEVNRRIVFGRRRLFSGKSTVTFKKSPANPCGGGLSAVCSVSCAFAVLSGRFRDVSLETIDRTRSWLPFVPVVEISDRFWVIANELDQLHTLIMAISDRAKYFEFF